MSGALRSTFFDASALVKLHIDEDGSDIVRAFFNRESTRYTTPFCFYETLGTFKLKWKRKEIDKDKYLDAAPADGVVWGSHSAHRGSRFLWAYRLCRCKADR